MTTEQRQDPRPLTAQEHLASVLQAGKHWTAAAQAVLDHDDAKYHREMAAFKRISETWTRASLSQECDR